MWNVFRNMSLLYNCSLKYHTPAASHTALRVTLEKMDITWRFVVEWSWSKVSFLDKPVFPWKSREITMPWATLFWGVVAWPYIWIWVDVYPSIHVTHKQPKIPLERCSSVASLSLGCVSNVNTHNIPTTSSWNDEFFWIYQQIDGILLGSSHTFSRHTHTQKPLDFSEFWGISFKGRPWAPHGTSQSATGVPRYPALHCHWPLTSLRFQGNGPG